MTVKPKHIGTAPSYSLHPTAGVVPILGWRPRRLGTRYFYAKDYPACTYERGFRWRNDEVRRAMLSPSLAKTEKGNG